MKLWDCTNPGRAAVFLGLVSMIAGCGAEVSGGAVSSGTTLCQNQFETCINPIFNRAFPDSSGVNVTCASGGCHEVGAGFGGSFKIYPNAGAGSTEMLANYLVSKAFANLVSAPDSKLLLEPLAGSSSITGSHTGGDIFPNNSDACYAAIRNWISNKVSDPADPVRCLPCSTVPADVDAMLATCGYPP